MEGVVQHTWEQQQTKQAMMRWWWTPLVVQQGSVPVAPDTCMMT